MTHWAAELPSLLESAQAEVDHLRALAWEGWERVLMLEKEQDEALASLPLIHEVTRTEAVKALGHVYRHNVGPGKYPEIGVVEVQQARQVVTSLIADRDWLRGRVRALERERDQAMAEIARLAARVAVLEAERGR